MFLSTIKIVYITLGYKQKDDYLRNIGYDLFVFAQIPLSLHYIPYYNILNSSFSVGKNLSLMLI